MTFDSSSVVRAARALRAVLVAGIVGGAALVTAGAAAGTTPSLPAGTSGGTKPTVPAALVVSCAQAFDTTLADITPNSALSRSSLSPTALVLDYTAYSSTEGTSRMIRQGDRITGGFDVGTFPRPTTTAIVKPLTIELFKAPDGKPMLKWRVDGNTFQAPVGSCQSRTWSASAGRSTIVVRIAPAENAPG